MCAGEVLRTVLSFPDLNASVGLSRMKCPSTTGTQLNVPKKAFAAMLNEAFCKAVVGAERRQDKVSALEAQLVWLTNALYKNFVCACKLQIYCMIGVGGRER